ncbi:hypothetical protein [Nostoc sp. FACHB-888]|uniref:hypothetical protein n=1 Tax=Nostoc sp. FACHB-888 TaxID=2692842 RepID=UPI001685852F|nr:hypothetical protein [Nostoc sp. FACHB-888]MBD2248599.1 hypothetical protein [Nostoc sp. FACHB-888]
MWTSSILTEQHKALRYPPFSRHPFSPMRRICQQLSKLLRVSVFKLQHHAATSGITPSILELLAFRDYGKIQDYAGET